MQISYKDWLNYINKLSKLNKTAGQKMVDFVTGREFSDPQSIIDYAYALVTKYGEGSAALSAAMYDAIAEVSKKMVPAAEVAPTADYDEVARAVQGTMKQSKNPKTTGSTVSRLVKQAGADTMLKNAARDGAQFAWVPVGDTCPFCITLASRGFQKMSKKALKNGHAEHIHANCDCNYTVRFDNTSGVEGYDPDEYLVQYNNAEGDTPKEKINAMRRAQYAADPEKYRAQKRAAYAERKTLVKTISVSDFDKLKEEMSKIAEESMDKSNTISDSVIDEIYDELEKLGGLKEFRSVTIKPLDSGIVFDTEMKLNGTWYNCHLVINESFFKGKTLETLEKTIKSSNNTVCNSLEECLKHEIAHAQQTDKVFASVIERINDQDGVEGISPLAKKDMLESLAEASVLRDRGQYETIPEKSRQLLDIAAKELGLW